MPPCGSSKLTLVNSALSQKRTFQFFINKPEKAFIYTAFVACKLYKCGVPAISSMGAGNKLDPTRFEVDDIYKTSVCPLAKVMRRELKKRGIKKLKVVYSREEPVKLPENACPAEGKKRVPASIAFVPSTVGLIIAGEVIKDLISYKGENK